MLSPHDADLVRRDPALPGLATLLDPEAFVEALRLAFPKADLGRGRIGYLRYKPGTSCLVSYRVDVAGAPVELSARALRADDGKKLAKAQSRPGVPGPLGPGRFALESRAITVSVFPNDARLEVLSRLDDPTERVRRLKAC